MQKARYIIVDLFDGETTCTDDLCLAMGYADTGDFSVIDTSDFTYAVPDDFSFTWKNVDLVEE